jgi:hypothetical protein
MKEIRCPECQLNLSAEEGGTTGRLWCPGCGTLFRVDQATGVITVYYDEAVDAPDGEPSPADPQGDAAGDSSAPLGYVDTAAAEQREARENREARARWRLYLSLLFIAAGCAYGAFKAVTAPAGDREDFLLRTLIVAPIGGLLLGFMVADLIFRGSPASSRLWLFGRRPEAPDFDDIAKRLGDRIVRRPLPPSDPPAPPEAGQPTDGGPGSDAVTPPPRAESDPAKESEAAVKAPREARDRKG